MEKGSHWRVDDVSNGSNVALESGEDRPVSQTTCQAGFLRGLAGLGVMGVFPPPPPPGLRPPPLPPLPPELDAVAPG